MAITFYSDDFIRPLIYNFILWYSSIALYSNILTFFQEPYKFCDVLLIVKKYFFLSSKTLLGLVCTLWDSLISRIFNIDGDF